MLWAAGIDPSLIKRQGQLIEQPKGFLSILRIQTADGEPGMNEQIVPNRHRLGQGFEADFRLDPPVVHRGSGPVFGSAYDTRWCSKTHFNHRGGFYRCSRETAIKRRERRAVLRVGDRLYNEVVAGSWMHGDGGGRDGVFQ